MMMIPDEDADRLSLVPEDSAEYKKLFLKATIAQSDKWHANSAWMKLESLYSFNQFGWTLDPEDSLYGQKVYTHLDLSYDPDSPKGMPDLTFDENTRESWVAPENVEQPKSTAIKTFPLTAGVIALIWFLLTR